MTRFSLWNVRGDLKNWALGLGLLSSGVSGCVDPKADYEEFVQRPVPVREAGTVDVAQSPCQEVLAQNLDGNYYGSCLIKAVGLPFALSVVRAVRPSADGMTGEIDVSFAALRVDAKTLADVTGPTTVLKPLPVDAECRFREDVGTLILPAAANTLNRDFEATNVVLREKLLSAERSCAELDGQVPLASLSFDSDGDICVYVHSPDGSLPTVNMEDYVCDPSLLLPR
jgi:hypothetical protein